MNNVVCLINADHNGYFYSITLKILINSDFLCKYKIKKYLAEDGVQGLVLCHELIQEDFEGVDPHLNGRLPPVSLLLAHGLLQDVLKQSVQVLVADTLPIIHLDNGLEMHIRGTEYTFSLEFKYFNSFIPAFLYYFLLNILSSGTYFDR